MDSRRLSLAAARALRLNFRLLCLVCGHSTGVPATILGRGRDPLTRVEELSFRCRSCQRREVAVEVFDPPAVEPNPDPGGFMYRLDRWSADCEMTIVAGSADLLIGHAAFEAAVVKEPEARWTLRHATRLIRSNEKCGDS